MGRDLRNNSLDTRRNTMDFTKVDFTKFDAAKLFDVTNALDQIESNTKTALGYIPDAKSRDIAQVLVEASMNFAREQAQAAQKFAESVKSAMTTR
jgi:hypothetical protein